MVELTRTQIRPGVKGVDVTVKSAVGFARSFAPTWKMVMGYKNGSTVAPLDRMSTRSRWSPKSVARNHFVVVGLEGDTTRVEVVEHHVHIAALVEGAFREPGVEVHADALEVVCNPSRPP